MLLFVECIAACVLFTVMILVPLLKNPVGQIMSYPKPIRRRVESLPQYQSVIRQREKRHLFIKIASVFLFAGLLAFVAYASGAVDFRSAFWHVFILFFSVNIYDALVLDLGYFCHSKRVRIPGTEDMDQEYKSPAHHLWGAVIGTGLSVVVALLAALLVLGFNTLFR